MKVAITGHQNLGNEKAQNWLENQLEFEIINLHVQIGYSCLAIGADQLFVNVLIKYKIPFIAIIPCYNYEQTFDQKDIYTYSSLLNQAMTRIHLDHDQPSEMAFFDASKFMIEKSEILIAVWNGLRAKGFGGTADVVSYAKEMQKKIIHLNPFNQTIKFL